MDIEVFGAWISSVGFPIAVAAFVLIRLNGSLDKLRDELQKLRELLLTMKGE